MAAALQRPIMAERTRLLKSCSTIARQRSRLAKRDTPAICPTVVQQFLDSCSKVAPGAELRPKFAESRFLEQLCRNSWTT